MCNMCKGVTVFGLTCARPPTSRSSVRVLSLRVRVVTDPGSWQLGTEAVSTRYNNVMCWMCR